MFPVKRAKNHLIGFSRNFVLIVVFVPCFLTGCQSSDATTPDLEPTVWKTNIPASESSRPLPVFSATYEPTAVMKPLPPVPLPVERPTANSFGICSPLAMESIDELFEIVSDPYKPPPENRAEERHHGVDFSHYARKDVRSIEFEPAQSILDGTVAAKIVDRNPYGNMVIIESKYDIMPSDFSELIGLDPKSSLYVLYAHLAEPSGIDLHDEIQCGQVIGEVGKTGYNIVNPHLHLEIRIGPPDIIFEEMAFYTTTASQVEMDSYKRWRTGGEFKHIDPMLVFERYLQWKPEVP